MCSKAEIMQVIDEKMRLYIFQNYRKYFSHIDHSEEVSMTVDGVHVVGLIDFYTDQYLCKPIIGYRVLAKDMDGDEIDYEFSFLLESIPGAKEAYKDFMAAGCVCQS